MQPVPCCLNVPEGYSGDHSSEGLGEYKLLTWKFMGWYVFEGTQMNILFSWLQNSDSTKSWAKFYLFYLSLFTKHASPMDGHKSASQYQSVTTSWETGKNKTKQNSHVLSCWLSNLQPVRCKSFSTQRNSLGCWGSGWLTLCKKEKRWEKGKYCSIITSMLIY